jgi:hypothetical protein
MWVTVSRQTALAHCKQCSHPLGRAELRGRVADKRAHRLQVALEMRLFLFLVFLLMAGSSALLTTLLPPQVAAPGAAAPPPPPPPPAGATPSCPSPPEEPTSNFQTYAGSLLQLFIVMMGGVVRVHKRLPRPARLLCAPADPPAADLPRRALIPTRLVAGL